MNKARRVSIEHTSKETQRHNTWYYQKVIIYNPVIDFDFL